MDDNLPTIEITAVENLYQEFTTTVTNLVVQIIRPDVIISYAAIAILSLLLIVVVYFGGTSEWYQSLKEPDFNPWIARSLWVVAQVSMYAGIYFINRRIGAEGTIEDSYLSSVFIIPNFIVLAWAISLYYADDVALSLWLSSIVFIYYFWMFDLVWSINRYAALFFLPNLIMYIYLVYFTIQIITANLIPI